MGKLEDKDYSAETAVPAAGGAHGDGDDPRVPEDLQAVLDGKPDAIRRFIQRWGPFLKHEVIMSAQRNGLPLSRVDDVLSDVIDHLFRDRCSALRKWKPDGGRSLETWLRFFPERRTIDHVRRLRRETPTEDEKLHLLRERGAPPPDKESLAAEAVALFRKRASAADRACLDSMLAGESAAEAAAKLGITKDAYYKRCQRIRDWLREIYLELCGSGSLPSPVKS